MRSSRPTRFPTALLTAVALTGTLAACRDGSEPFAPPPTGGAADVAEARAFTARPALLDALADAEARLAVALAEEGRGGLRAALAELHDALDAGQAARHARAVAVVRARLAAPAAAADPAEAADRAAIALVVDAADSAAGAARAR